MQLGDFDYELLLHLREGRLTPRAADYRTDKSYGHVRRRLSRLVDAGLARRLEPEDAALYELTEMGDRALALREEYEADEEMDRFEFRRRVQREVFDRGPAES